MPSPRRSTTTQTMASAAMPWMTNWPKSVSASAHSPPTVQYRRVTTPVIRMPVVIDIPVNTLSSTATDAHLAATSNTLSRAPLQARACWVGTL